MITDSSALLKLGGSMLTIATSLQGWKKTQKMLNEHWNEWSVIDEVVLPLTDEYRPEYVAWWRAEQSRAGEKYLWVQGGETLHTLWFIHARNAGPT